MYDHYSSPSDASSGSLSGNQHSISMQNNIPTTDQSNSVLLIEDNPGDARLVELLLGESDLLSCDITKAVTLAEGMQAIESKGGFSAVLLDLSLPDSRGFETLDTLLEKYPDSNVIVLTGFSDKEMGVKAVQAGAQDFLVKGAFDSESLAKSLRYSIERSLVIKRLEESQRIAHIGNWEFDPSKGEFTASDEISRIFGLAPRKEPITLESINDSTSPLHIFKKIHQDTKEKGEVKDDVMIRLANGTTRYIFFQCTRNSNINGQLVFNGILQDITERMQAEMEMKKSQERYQDIFTKSRDAIYICDLEGQLVDFNDATATLLGHTRESLEEIKNIHTFFQALDGHVSFLQELIDEKAVKDVELVFMRPNKEKRYCLLTANIIDTPDFQGYNGILRDITERKQAEELIKARDVARQSAMMKEQFIASVSHEMRTPMNAILGMSNLLIKTELDPEQKDYVSSVRQSSEILLGVINDILEISTLQNGKINFEHSRFDLHQLLGNLINVMQYKKEEKALNFELTIDDNVPQFIEGDKLRLNQILYNLAGNAVKFTDDGFVKVKVNVLSQGSGKVHLHYSVQDSGIGIPKDKLGAIFETFTRVRSKERIFEGTGLGLSIAKNLVEQQNGNIGVDSEMGTGSTFYFDMIFDVSVDQTTAEGADKDEDAGSNHVPTEVINLLLVEDHKMNQIVARKTLERQYESMIKITIANNGQEAVNILEENLFDIILMDIQMPIMDGYETTQHIRNKMPEQVSRIPILAMTAHAHISKDEKFKEYGMDDFVLKPFEPDQLFSKISKYTKK